MAWYWILLIALGSAAVLVWLAVTVAIGCLGWKMWRDF